MISELLFYALISGTVLYTFYKWATANNDYFAKQNLKYLKPNFLVGNTIGLFMKRYIPTEFIDSIYHRYPDEKVIGFFDMRKPVYLVRDLDFMRQITIKDFDNFEDHASFIEGTSDTLLGNGLFLLTGKKWRDMRATLSPAFTGSKMRHMFELVTECANDMTKYLINESEKGNPIRWEMKDLFSRYTLDVIASCAFGLKVDSLRDPTNEFFRNGTNCLKFNSFRAAIRLILVRTLPKLMKFFNFDIFPTRIKQFFKSMVLDTMNEREKKIIFRPDMINILMQVRHGALKHENGKTHDDDAGFATVEESNIGKIQVKQSWTDDEIVAQCFLFFAAGFDTASTLMSFLSYELAINPDIQRKLYDEICQVNKELNGGRLTYDILSKLKYLDQVISEGLRKWPPAIFNNRKCTKDFDFVLNGKKIFIERGRPIWIPTFSIHHDPKFFPDPKKFDPERFSDKNKHKIIPGSYIPFGMGPRNCIGSRFALMEIKALLFHLLLNFNIQPYEETQIPLKIANSAINWAIENGIHLELRPRI